MPDPLDRWQQFGLAAASEVVRTVVVVSGEHTYRVEVLKSYSRPGFSARAWIERDAILHGHGEDASLNERVLVEYDLPLTEDEDADVVLTRALRFLAEDVHDE
jgi:hypothetical protein